MLKALQFFTRDLYAKSPASVGSRTLWETLKLRLLWFLHMKWSTEGAVTARDHTVRLDNHSPAAHGTLKLEIAVRCGSFVCLLLLFN